MPTGLLAAYWQRAMSWDARGSARLAGQQVRRRAALRRAHRPPCRFPPEPGRGRPRPVPSCDSDDGARGSTIPVGATVGHLEDARRRASPWPAASSAPIVTVLRFGAAGAWEAGNTPDRTSVPFNQGGPTSGQVGLTSGPTRFDSLAGRVSLRLVRVSLMSESGHISPGGCVCCSLPLRPCASRFLLLLQASTP